MELDDADCSVKCESSPSSNGLHAVPNSQRVRKRKFCPNAKNGDEPPSKKQKLSSTRKSKKSGTNKELNVLSQLSSTVLDITRALDRDRFDDEEGEGADSNPARRLKITVLAAPATAANTPRPALWVKADDILRRGFGYNAASTPSLSETKEQFVCDVRRYLRRNGISSPLSTFLSSKGPALFLSEKGFCLLMLMMRDFDGVSVGVEHWIAFRFYYRAKLFGSKTKGLMLSKPQSSDTMEICTVCGFEDLPSRFEYDNHCDCECVVHRNCERLEAAYSADSEFCPLCTAYAPLEQLRARRECVAAGEFEVEWVVDYDAADDQYLVKWKGYPMEAIAKTDVAASFIECVRQFWAKPENQPIPERAQRGIEALGDGTEDLSDRSNSSNSGSSDEKMSDSVDSIGSAGDGRGVRAESTDEIDHKMNTLEIESAAKESPKALGEGIFVIVKLSEVMDSEYIVRRQKYTKQTFDRMKATQSKYRKWLQSQIQNESPLGVELKHEMRARGTNRMPKHHLRSVNKDWDCDLPRIRDLILEFLRRDWKRWTHDLSHPAVVIAEIIDPLNPAKRYGADQGVHEHRAFGLFAVGAIRRDSILFEYAGCVTPIGVATQKLSHLENELDQTTLFDLIGHLDADRAKLFWGKRPNDQLVVDPSRWHNEGVFMNDYRDRVLDDPDDDDDDEESSGAAADGGGRPSPNDNLGRVQNVKFYEVLVNGWPRVFAVALQDIAAGEELLGDYGNEFWKNFRLMMRRQHQLKEIKQRIHGEWQRKYDDLLRRFERQSDELRRLRLAVEVKNEGRS